MDAYSDLDVWLDVDGDRESDAIAAVEAALAGAGRLDYRHVLRDDHPLIRQRVYHLEGGTSPYLMIDCCWKPHSRDPREYAISGAIRWNTRPCSSINPAWYG